MNDCGKAASPLSTLQQADLTEMPSIGQHHQRFDTLGLLPFLALEVLGHLINWLLVFSSEAPHLGSA